MASMRFKTASVLALGGVALMTACAQLPPVGQAYWQRVNSDSALYMTGPKAQQRLDDDIASCVNQVDELVRLDAVREALPADTYSDYRNALKASGDLSYYDTPTRMGDKKVADVNFHDYEGCMRYKGWERVRYVRYTTLAKANGVYQETHQYWKTGLMGPAAETADQKKIDEMNSNYGTLNK